MKATTLVQAVKEITGRRHVSEEFAKEYANTHYLEIVSFINYESKRDEMIKDLKTNRAAVRIANKIQGLKAKRKAKKQPKKQMEYVSIDEIKKELTIGSKINH